MYDISVVRALMLTSRGDRVVTCYFGCSWLLWFTPRVPALWLWLVWYRVILRLRLLLVAGYGRPWLKIDNSPVCRVRPPHVLRLARRLCLSCTLWLGRLSDLWRGRRLWGRELRRCWLRVPCLYRRRRMRLLGCGRLVGRGR